MASACNIVVLGAGVSGLTTALLLSQDPRLRITVAAKHTPGDYDIEYASPWAGANFAVDFAVGKGEKEVDFHLKTWLELLRLAREVPEAGVVIRENVVYLAEASSEFQDWFADLVSKKPWAADAIPDFRALNPNELPTGVSSGYAYTGVCINTPQYLHYLAGQCLRNGVQVKRANVSHILQARDLPATHHPADIIINCTGLSSARLGGVTDPALYPARGQVVVVRNEVPGAQLLVLERPEWGIEMLYMMPRGVGGGTVLGGCYQEGRTDAAPDMELAGRIMQRAVELCPDLAGGKGVEGLDVIRHGVGLRPVRKGGIRVEREKIMGGGGGGGVWVVHNYGHAGMGYQTSYGCAEEVVRCVGKIQEDKAAL